MIFIVIHYYLINMIKIQINNNIIYKNLKDLLLIQNKKLMIVLINIIYYHIQKKYN